LHPYIPPAIATETAEYLGFHVAEFYQTGGYFMTNIRPLHDRVIVQRLEQEEKSAGGIIIPDAAKEKPIQGEVIAVGPGGRDETGKKIPMDVKVGDIVLFGKWAGTEVKLEGEDFLVLKESDIIGVVENKGAKKKAA
jgi:chaperonin GroES